MARKQVKKSANITAFFAKKSDTSHGALFSEYAINSAFVLLISFTFFLYRS